MISTALDIILEMFFVILTTTCCGDFVFATVPNLPYDAHEIHQVYDTVPRSDEVFNLNKNDIRLTKELGGGNFGSVMLGEYHRGSQTIPVAVKTLKQADMSTAEVLVC